MEHILQFAINIDDEAIEKRIIENAEKNITSDIKREVMKMMFSVNPWSDRITDNPTEWTRMQIESFLVGHKDEIIQCAGKLLAEKLVKTKTVKEMLGGLAEDQS